MFLNTNPLLSLAIVLVFGVAGGACARLLRLPAITGQILVGVLMGPSVFEFFDVRVIEGLKPITHFALGLIVVAVGSHLNFRRLKPATKRLTLMLLLESTITPALVFLGVYVVLPGTSWTLAVLLAAIAISTAPATIIAIVKETRSKGVFVKTLVASVALNNIACILIFQIAYTATRVSLDPGSGQEALDVLVAPFKQLGASALLGGCAGVALVAVTRHVVLTERLATASLITILLTSGLADYLGVSSLLSCLFLGVTLANIAPEKEELGHAVFADFESAIFTVFFTLAGIGVDLQHLVTGGLLAILVIVTRMLGKLAAARLAMGLAGATENVRKYLGIALVPQAGVAVGLILLVQENPVFSPIRDLFLTVGLAAVTINDILGPIFTRTALMRSGDYGKDRARLIDFIHEENITSELKGETKEEVIGRLVDLLIKSRKLSVDRDRLLKSVLDREEEMSTCLGGGLAIPHGVLEEGEEIVGVMGISREGLRLDTPDGLPVHCMVLLMTPPAQRDRHLEVLAALAWAIGSDRYIQRQLYSAKSPAHVCEILYQDKLEDFNYFLEGLDEE